MGSQFDTQMTEELTLQTRQPELSDKTQTDGQRPLMHRTRLFTEHLQGNQQTGGSVSEPTVEHVPFA